MTALIASIGEDKGTWGHVSKMIENGSFDEMFIIADKKYEGIFSEERAKFIYINSTKAIPELVDDIHLQIKDLPLGTEVAVNLVSGSGKEHMAMLSAILRSGLGLRLTALTKDGVKEI